MIDPIITSGLAGVVPGSAEGEGFVEPETELPEEKVQADKERDPSDMIRDLTARLRDCSEEVDRYYERYGPLADE